MAAEKIEQLGATAVWFEDFGGRDDSAEEAFLAEVDSSTIYVAILNERYGRRASDGFSATHAEYRRALAGGKRISIWVASEAPNRDGDLVRFIDDLQTFHVTGAFADLGDLSNKLERRLKTLAAEAVSPWVKLGDYVFRADQISQTSTEVAVSAVMDLGMARRIEALRQEWGRTSIRLAYEDAVVEGDLDAVERSVRAGQPSQITIRIARPVSPRSEGMRAGTSGHSAEDLVEAGLRHEFLGEGLPSHVASLPFLAETGLERPALRTVFDLPNEVAEAIARVVISHGLVGSGRAAAITNFRLGPRTGDKRRLLLEWEDPRRYTNVQPSSRRVEGDWHRPE